MEGNDREGNDRGEGPGAERLSEIADELREIQEEMLGRLDEMRALLAEAGCDGALMRAESYWMAHAKCALTDDHQFLGGSMYTLSDSINDVEEVMAETMAAEVEAAALAGAPQAPAAPAPAGRAR